MNHPIRKAPLSEEILGESDQLRVFVTDKPFDYGTAQPVDAGLTIAEIVERCGVEGQEYDAFHEGYLIKPEAWRVTRPKPGTDVILRMSAGEPGSITAIVTALSSAFEAATAAYATLGAFGQAIVGTVVAAGANLLINALFGTRPPKLRKEPEATPSYSITGSRNSAAPWEAVPVVLGEHRVTPYYGALPFSQSINQDQHFRCLFVVGYGPLEITDIRIGETPIDSFSDVSYEIRTGYVGESGVTLYTGQPLEETLSVNLQNVDGWQQRTTFKDITRIELDVVFPQGVYWVDGKKGERHEYTVILDVEYRVAGSNSAFSSIPSIVQTTKDPNLIRRTTGIDVPLGQYEVRIRKVTGDQNPESKDTIVDDVSWVALRSYRPDEAMKFNRPLAIIAVRIKATSQLNGQLDTLNCMAYSRVTSYAPGVWTGNILSRNPADLFRHVLQGPANARPVGSDEIDLEALQEWFSYCYQNSFYFDYVVSSRVGVWDQLLDICAAGRAVPFFKNGLWSVVWDERNTPIVQMFTPANSWGFEYGIEYPEPIHAFRVRFVNREKGYIEDERIVYDDGYSAANATNFEGLEFPGVTDPAAIWRHGRFHIAQQRLRPATYTLTVDFENLVCTRGDRVRVMHDAALIGVQSGRVTAINQGAQTVTLDEEITVGVGLYRLRFRLPNGDWLVRDVASAAGTISRTLQLSGAGAMPEVGDLFAFGLRDMETGVFRILSIEPGADLTATLTLVDDAPGISDADTGTIPAFDSNVTRPIDPFTLPPLDLRTSESVFSSEGEVTVVLRLNWRVARQGASQFQAEMRDDTSGAPVWRPIGSVDGSQTFIDTAPLPSGTFSFRVRAIFADGTWSDYATLEGVSTAGILVPPADVGSFKISVIGDVSLLEWAAVRTPGVASYEIRHLAADGVSGSWNSATPLLPVATGTSAQVPTKVGTYLIKATLASGLQSVNAAVIRTNIVGLSNRNVVEIVDEAPAFAGTLGAVEVEAGALRLARRAMISKWESLDTVISLDEGDGGEDNSGAEAEGFYGFANAIDLGDVFTSRLSARIDAEGESLTNTIDNWISLDDVVAISDADPTDWGVELQYRATNDDPAGLPVWGEFIPFVVGDVTARAFEFRLRMTGRVAGGLQDTYATVTPVVRGLSVEVDMPDRVFGDKDVTVPATGLRINFDPPFIALKSVTTADQDLATGDFKTITDKSESGFFVQFFNADGTPVERTFDYSAVGYGSRHA